LSRRSRLSSSGRSDSREGDTTESLSRSNKKKRRSEERLAKGPENSVSVRSFLYQFIEEQLFGPSRPATSASSHSRSRSLDRNREYRPIECEEDSSSDDEDEENGIGGSRKQSVVRRNKNDDPDGEVRRAEIEQNRLERQRRRAKERKLAVERFIKSMRLLQLNDRGEEEERRVGTEFLEGEEPYEDYTFHLYRKVGPDFEERRRFLEQKLSVSVIVFGVTD